MLKKIFDTVSYMLIDVIVIAMTYVFSLFVLSQFGVNFDTFTIFRSVPIIILIKVGIFFVFRVYEIIPKYIGFDDLFGILLLSFSSNILIVALLTIYPLDFINRSSFLIIAPFEMIFLALPRMAYRFINYIETTNKWYKAIGKRTLIIGAGQAAELVLKEIFKNKELNLLPIGILDDDVKKRGQRLMGIKIFGDLSSFEKICKEYHITDVVIAINGFPYEKMQDLYDKVKDLDIRIQRLVGISDVAQTPLLKELRIEDLLNRPVIELDNSGIEDLIADEVVLVTGGGGSIGSELVRQVAHYRPKTLIIFDIYENNAYDIQMDIQRQFQKLEMAIPFEFHVIIGSVYVSQSIREVFKTYHPTIVFHAAAYKHVPLMERNYKEAIRTNVVGTYNVIRLADEFKAKRMTMISTDKAVRSTNIMGATKRLAEKIMQSYQPQSDLLLSAVRFGNVLNSNGSVIPLFMKQIKDGGPINVTHKDITRFFMTIPEAVSLVLQSMLYMKGQDIFVLDMGEPVKIYDLAENMIRLMGLRPHVDIKINIIGLRPGEKLYEELLLDNEFIVKTSNGRIFKEEKPFEPITFDIDELPDANVATKKEIVDFLTDKVESYNPKNV
jgi:FlaA1/EpsC-like NDP-sugar epimerase